MVDGVVLPAQREWLGSDVGHHLAHVGGVTSPLVCAQRPDERLRCPSKATVGLHVLRATCHVLCATRYVRRATGTWPACAPGATRGHAQGSRCSPRIRACPRYSVETMVQSRGVARDGCVERVRSRQRVGHSLRMPQCVVCRNVATLYRRSVVASQPRIVIASPHRIVVTTSWHRIVVIWWHRRDAVLALR